MAVSLKKVLSHLALSLSEMTLYFPKGFFLGAAEFFDNMHSKMKCKAIACVYCDRHIQPKKRAYLKKKWNAFFKFMHTTLRCFFILCLSPLYLLMAIMPHATEKYCLNKLKSLAIKTRQLLKWATSYRTKASYYVMLPCLLLVFCAQIWGIGIIPEIYIFLAASSWSGAILNFAANLLVRGSNSEEWQFAKNWWTIVFKPHNNAGKDLRWHLFKNSIRLAVELTLITGIGRLAHFIGYATSAFFSWLLAYVLYKAAAEEGQNLVLGLEDKMADKKKASLSLNSTWLITYHLYRASCSTKSIEDYRALHQNKHQYAFRITRRRTTP